MKKEQNSGIDMIINGNAVHLEFAAEPNEKVIDEAKRMLMGGYAETPIDNADVMPRTDY